jgi:hypothetical protein
MKVLENLARRRFGEISQPHFNVSLCQGITTSFIFRISSACINLGIQLLEKLALASRVSQADAFGSRKAAVSRAEGPLDRLAEATPHVLVEKEQFKEF